MYVMCVYEDSRLENIFGHTQKHTLPVRRLMQDNMAT